MICIQSLGQEDPVQEERATHCSFLAWRVPQTKKAGGLESMGLQNSRTQLIERARTDILFSAALNHLLNLSELLYTKRETVLCPYVVFFFNLFK